MKVLIADDQKANLKLLRAQLEAEGHVVMDAADGLAALELLQRETVDAIITDILMPRMDGYRLCYEIRTNPTHRDIPIIVFTATYTSPADEKLARDVGASAYLRKPAAVREILDQMEAVCQSRMPPVTQTKAERTVMREYSTRLVAKLEEKSIELLLHTTAMETAANAMVITDAQGVILWTNPAFTTQTGYSAAEAIGRTPRLLKSGRHAPAFYRDFWATILAGQPWHGEFTNRRKDGSLFYDEHTVTPVRATGGAITHFIGIMHDVTARKQAEEELRAAHAQCQMMLKYSPAVLYILKLKDGEVLPYLASENVADLLGFAVAETLSMEWWNRQVHPDDHARAFASIGETLTHGTCRSEYRMRHKNGDYRWVEDRRRLVRDSDGQPAEFVGIWTDITERKQAAEAVNRIRERLQLATDAAQIGIWDWDIATNTLIWDKKMYELYGLREEDFIGAYDAWLNGLHPDDRAKGKDAVAAALSGTRDFDLTFRVLWPSGEVRHIEAHGVVLRADDGTAVRMTGVNRDITDRVKAEVALQMSENRFKTLFEQAAVGVVQAEVGSGRFVHVNERFCRIVGYSREEVEGLTFAGITHPDDIERSREAAQRIASGEIREANVEKRYVRKDGSAVWVSLTVSAMWRPGETPDYFIAMVQDITERKKLEAQYLQAQKMEAIGTLAGGIAHDFNNILGAIIGYAELARMNVNGKPAVAGEYLGSLLGGAQRAAALVRQILAFSRQQEQQRSLVQLRYLVREALDLLRATLPSTISLEADLAGNLPAVMADATQVHQVVMNLCTNAWQAMKGGPGRLKVSLARFEVDAHLARSNPDLQPGPYMRLTVSDTGHGMDKATMGRIFEPFFTTKAPGEGTGLGLAAVHGIMKAHAGAITVYSQPGEGATFHAYFPAQAGEAEAHDATVAPIPRGRGEQVLFVDDEHALALLGGAMLDELGYSVTVSSNPQEALELVRAAPAKFALVVTDQTMPGLTGTELAAQLWQSRPDLPVLLSTGYSATLTAEAARAMGMSGLLLKPQTLRSLGTAVHRVLQSNNPP